ncbi:MAG: hypothetical protein U0V02_04675 [Anaerolineales bacterium]
MKKILIPLIFIAVIVLAIIAGFSIFGGPPALPSSSGYDLALSFQLQIND